MPRRPRPGEALFLNKVRTPREGGNTSSPLGSYSVSAINFVMARGHGMRQHAVKDSSAAAGHQSVALFSSERCNGPLASRWPCWRPPVRSQGRGSSRARRAASLGNNRLLFISAKRWPRTPRRRLLPTECGGELIFDLASRRTILGVKVGYEFLRNDSNAKICVCDLRTNHFLMNVNADLVVQRHDLSVTTLRSLSRGSDQNRATDLIATDFDDGRAKRRDRRHWASRGERGL